MNISSVTAMNTSTRHGLLARLLLRERQTPFLPKNGLSADHADGVTHHQPPLLHRERVSCRSVWISDVHLGTRACKAEYLYEFLCHLECDRLFLVGDMIDFWNLKSGWYWPASHNRVLQKIIEMANRGVEVIYVPGNHDEIFRDYAGSLFGGVRVESRVTHRTADGRRFLVIHGDEFDGVVKYSKWLAVLGSQVYDFLLYANRWVNYFRRKLGFPYWSLAAYLKQKAKSAVSFISNFEQALALEAQRSRVDGVICGHIHHAEIQTVNGVLYCNDGDWVESCTAMVERADGTLAILRWTDKLEWLIEEQRATHANVQEAA